MLDGTIDQIWFSNYKFQHFNVTNENLNVRNPVTTHFKFLKVIKMDTKIFIPLYLYQDSD